MIIVSLFVGLICCNYLFMSVVTMLPDKNTEI